MKITPRDLLELRGSAIKNWSDTSPESILLEDGSNPDETGFVAMSWLKACIAFLHAKTGVDVTIDTQTSEPDAE